MNNAVKELEQARAEAIAKDKCFSKTRLREEFRMKPKEEAEPVAFYKNDYGGKFAVYKIADCVPMRSKVSKPATSKQKQARAVLAIKTKLKSKHAKASNRAVSWLESEPLFLDSESTGLGSNAQIIELAIANSHGKILFESRIKPTIEIEQEAIHIHGITKQDLEQSPTWTDISANVQSILTDRPLIIFNDNFDVRLLRQTAQAHGEPTEWIKALKTHCAMQLAAYAFGPTNRHGSISLSDAVLYSRIEWRGEAHSAVADTLTTVDLVRSIADYGLSLKQELKNLEN
ncbi:3'-5' exonuclease [Vibrio parahaemolyticus]|uniref:3'-5' exonuclease n=1 Tax=Vibrio parahaemolyticus TaxID=670 RepID=UPI00111E0CFC|nr:3'-5' exonuclease [Vibrio parahaemolyticus]MDG2676313.1 3'-5' exonuclease [Vibrio parahaemolyticus]TOA86236.1 DNA polymerase III subunit epsilon [Vibrio parahaemolyticus]HBH7899843.1 3'-5' exonuclease [Vibrio parahaemolyticus]